MGTWYGVRRLVGGLARDLLTDLARGPREVEHVVANIDIGPTILAGAGRGPPDGLDGRSFLGLTQGQTDGWRIGLLYEYY